MFNIIKKIYNISKLLSNVEVTYNKEKDLYLITTDSNISLLTTKNILVVSKEDTILVSQNLHLNPTVSELKANKIYNKCILVD